MIHKTFLQTDNGQIARVTFTLPVGTWADAIYLVGECNNWNHTSHPFQRNRQGAWIITVDLELGRSCQFRYRRDGEWNTLTYVTQQARVFYDSLLTVRCCASICLE